MILFNNLYSVLGAILVTYVLRLWIKRWNRLPLPPGPKGYPFIGSIYEIPRQYPWLTYADWAKEYGDVFSYNVVGKTTIVLNSLASVTELLEKRSFNYSDRPRLIMSNELVGWEWNFGHIGYTEKWRHHRRVFHQYFQPRNLYSYYPVQVKATLKLLEQLGHSPEQFVAHIRQHVGSIALRAAYGYDVQEENDFYIELVREAIQSLFLTVYAAGTYFVDFLPFLKYVPAWFPGAGFKRQAIIWSEGPKNILEIPFNNTKQEIADGVAQQSFVLDNLERIKTENLSNAEEEEEIVKNCAAVIYIAGSDTTASLLLVWILAMAHYPEVQTRAYAELEKAIGTSRLPNFNDKPAVPYIDAMILEAMRWHAIAPLAVPHRAMEEDVYNGYRIPAGAAVIPNAWAILHDEKIYPEPFKFKPERFLDEQQETISFDLQPDPTIVGGFGYGRRTCPGRHLAINTAWISVSNILATYNISKATDKNGNVIEPKIEFTDGLVSHPKPYNVNIVPRSDQTFELIDTAKMEMAS